MKREDVLEKSRALGVDEGLIHAENKARKFASWSLAVIAAMMIALSTESIGIGAVDHSAAFATFFAFLVFVGIECLGSYLHSKKIRELLLCIALFVLSLVTFLELLGLIEFFSVTGFL